MNTELMDKLNILGEAARYDASCASSGSGRQGKDGFGNGHMSGICHSWAEDGRCICLLKVLYSNACIYNCAYCLNRASANGPRATFTPQELAYITEEFYRRNYIEGLFLSSGVVKNPDYTMEQMIETLRILREERRFYGYIHVKVIPGADPALISRVGFLADRVSVNIELPTSGGLKLLAPQKKPQAILNPMGEIKSQKLQNEQERKRFRHSPLFAPAGQSTQLIVGATGDNDKTILNLSHGLYRKFLMRRVYFSAYIPVGTHPGLPGPDVRTPLRREHRLYQADWLMRFYKFDVGEIVDDALPNLPDDIDPKCAWALRHRELFPVEVNTADYELLLRIPGVGMRSAERIVAARRTRSLRLEDLRKLGIVMKRAQYFLTAHGKYGGRAPTDSPFLRSILSELPGHDGQLSLFDAPAPIQLPPAAPPAAAPALPAADGSPSWGDGRLAVSG